MSQENFSPTLRRERSPQVRPGAGLGLLGLGVAATGALALGALAIGAVAVGRIAIGGLVVRKARFRRVEIDELTVRRLHILDGPEG